MLVQQLRCALTHQHIEIRAEGVCGLVVTSLLPEVSFMQEASLQLPQQAACHSQEQSEWVAQAAVNQSILVKGTVGQQQVRLAICRASK